MKSCFENDDDAADKIAALFEMVGYSLFRKLLFERFVILIGDGANGKSIILDVVKAIIGSRNVAAVQPSQLDNEFQRAHLHGKLINVVTEMAEGQCLPDAAIKSLVSGETATVAHKHKTPFEMQPRVKFCFSTNHMPHTRDLSQGIFRRALIIVFNRSFFGKDADPNLRTRLMSEIPGIISHSIKAYQTVLIKNGFTNPASSDQAKNEWRLDADQVGRCIDELCEPHIDGFITTEEFYGRYKYWTKDSGIMRPLTSRTVRSRLTKLGVREARTSQIRGFSGFRWKTDGNDSCFKLSAQQNVNNGVAKAAMISTQTVTTVTSKNDVFG